MWKVKKTLPWSAYLCYNDPDLNDDDPERFEIKMLITLASFIQSKQTIHDKLEAKLDELLQILEQKEKSYKK